ncbi:MAG: hypothetical protein FWD68_12735 [Alphaproteobacteria bacterium]|nr:hypothetical protein [Alphaproteobacteria bacterium]
MKRILFSLTLASVTVAATFLGIRSFAQMSAISEIDALFERIRAVGGEASHGKVDFDAASRSLTIQDITIDTRRASSAARIRIGRLKATGVSQFTPDGFAASLIEVANVEVTNDRPGDTLDKLSYAIPQITLREFSAPVRLAAPATNGPTDVTRAVLEQFASVSAASVTMPGFTGSLSMSPPNPPVPDDTTTTKPDRRPAAPAEAAGAEPAFSFNVSFRTWTLGPFNATFAGSGISWQNLRQGRVEGGKIDRLTFSANYVAPKDGYPKRQTSELASLRIRDFDATPLIALLDPSADTSDRYRQIAAHLSLAPLSVTTESAGILIPSEDRIERWSVDDIAIQPSKLHLGLALINLPRSSPSTEGEKIAATQGRANILSALHIGRFELAGIVLHSPDGARHIDRIGYETSAFAIEGVTVPGAGGQDPTTLKHVTIRDLDIGRLMLATDTNRGLFASADSVLNFLHGLSGFELQGLRVPFSHTGKMLELVSLSLRWGPFTGSFPAQAELAVDSRIPVDPAASEQLQRLSSRGIDPIHFSGRLQLALSEEAGTFALTLPGFDVDKLFRTRLHLSLGNFSPAVFLGEPQAPIALAQIEAGPIEFSLADAGVIDLIAAEFGQAHDLSPDAARQGLIDTVKATGAALSNAQAIAASETIVRFLESPGQTIVIRLTPLSKFPVKAFSKIVRDDPASALNLFQIECSTTR